MIRITRAIRSYKEEISKLFVDAFFGYFEFLDSDKNKWYRALKNIFSLECFYVVLLDEEIIGIGACCDGTSSIKFRKFDLWRNFGYGNGNRIYKYLKTIFEDRDYAFDIDKECGMIEFVAVKNSYRNKKIGYTLINHMVYDNNYKRYLAKVGDINVSARKVLENSRFEVFDEEASTGIEKDKLGINKYFYMICENKKFSN